jgi:hypothetical protein
MAFFRWVDRGSGSKVVYVSIERSFFLVSSLYQTSETEHASFENIVASAPDECWSRFRPPPNRDNALQTGDPARTNTLACIARTRACKAVRIMRNLRRGEYASAHTRPAMSARETMRCFVAQDPLRRVRVRFQRAGCSSFQKFEIPALGLV